MRTGFTTSACAAAASAAAIHSLLTRQPITQVTINLPARRDVTFKIARCEQYDNAVLCGVIKDAGDDPDVTNGLEIQALVERAAEPGVVLLGGRGVGVVTLPGLPVPVGEPAINPGPRRLIRQVIQETLQALNADPNLGWRITIQVPDGERVAAQTLNPKLGIVGGISILGTDGIVRPYSAPAYRASIYYEMNVARQAGYTQIGLATGKRSAAYVRQYLNDHTGLGVVDVGDEIKYPLDKALQLGFQHILLGGMIGKLSKVAQGRLHTHVREGEVDFDFLAELAAALNAPSETLAKIRTARTAHQVQNWLHAIGIALEPEIARRAAEHVAMATERKVRIRVLLFSLDGKLLGNADIPPKD